MVDVGEVERRVEQVKAAGIPMEATVGGIILHTVTDLAKLSDITSRSKALPPHCRNDAAVCCHLAMKALEWGFPIISVLEQSFMVNDRLGYMSQLIHAIVERNAPIKHRLRYEIVGEGDERRCKVWATFKGESDPHVYLSLPLAKLRENRPRKKDGSGAGGSHLWDDNPEVQMFYSASRQWARIYCPDVILGAYTREELESAPIMDVTPKVSDLVQRLRTAAETPGDAQGFDPAKVRTTIEGEATDETDQANNKPDKPAPPPPRKAKRR